MTAVNNGPLVWSHLEESFRSLYGGCVIAGGSVRDWEHDQTIKPKDFDVFVPVDDDFDFDIRFWSLPFDGKRYAPKKSHYSGASDWHEVLGVGYCNVPDVPSVVNVIGRSREKIADPSLLMQDFDHSLCQFWWDGKRVLRTAAARESMETGQIKSFRDGDPRTSTRITELKYRQGYDRYLPKLTGLKPRKLNLPPMWGSGSDLLYPGQTTTLQNYAQRFANLI